MSVNSNATGKVIYFSHGGGPMPILGDPGHQSMVTFMKQLSTQIEKPDAILVISAHWEESVATVTGGEQTSLFYDYYGFPKETYTLTYPAPGNPQLAGRISSLLRENHIPVNIDTKRGLDHGVFIPLMLMYPEADIPVVQLSLVMGLDPTVHLSIGKALQPLLNDNILVIGSGFSFHNMQVFMSQREAKADSANDDFQDWLIETCSGTLGLSEREQRLTLWEQAPSARYCHPREEHLLPIHVCSAMAGEPGKIIFDDEIAWKRSIGVMWDRII